MIKTSAHTVRSWYLASACASLLSGTDAGIIRLTVQPILGYCRALVYAIIVSCVSALASPLAVWTLESGLIHAVTAYEVGKVVITKILVSSASALYLSDDGRERMGPCFEIGLVAAQLELSFGRDNGEAIQLFFAFDLFRESTGSFALNAS